MKSNDPNDPQQTLPPGQSRRRITVTDVQADEELNDPPTRRLKFGTPTRATATLRSDPNTPEITASVQRGFALGPEPRVESQAKSSSKPGVQPWILVVAGGAMVLLVVALLLSPGSASSAESAAQQKLVSQYTKYLESKGPSTNSALDINARKKDVVDRLQAVAWAKAIGDRAALENQLTGLLFLDDDKNSPLYQYSINQLTQIGVTAKKPGL
jgi:hypothetical protein